MRQEQNSSICISIHALREEGDPTTPVTVRCMFLFLSTPSARRATIAGVVPVNAELFLSTPSARRATHISRCRWAVSFISIHALREEGDVRH